jgi:hypothetical protein
MSYPANPPEGGYPPPGGPQPGQGEPAYPPASPYQPPTTPYSSPPAGNQFPAPSPEEQPSPPFAAGQPTAAMPAVGGYQQNAQPPYPGPSGAYDGYPPGSAPTQASGPPTMSGPPAMDPMSGPPGYGAPYSGAPYSGAPGYVAPKPKRGALVPILAALTALFFIAAAVMTGLYVSKTGAYDRKVSDLKARDTKISAQSGQIDDLNKQISTMKDQLDQAAQKQSGTQSQLDEQTKEKQVISNCLSLLEQALVYAGKGDQANAQATAKKADQPCEEASKYID